MGILSRARQRGEAFLARRLQDQAVALSFAIPGKQGPICELKLEAAAEPQADGERLHVRAHVHVRLRRGLHRDLKTWIEVRSSSASLDDGSRALVPERLNALGITPAPGKPLQTWAGGLPGPRPGFAMLTLMQLDKERLPAPLQQALGTQPFQLTATLASSIEEV